MSQHITCRHRRLFLACLSIICIMSASHAAFAVDQNVADGCDPKVMANSQKKAQARVCADIAVTEQLITKPRSVLELICFNKLATVASKTAKDIFSGELDLKIIEDALKAHYENFDEGAEKDNDQTKVSSSGSYTCDKMDKAWEAELDAGISKEVPTIITDADLMVDTPPLCDTDDDGKAEEACGGDFNAAWQACADKKVFEDYRKSVEEQTPVEVPDLSNCSGQGSAAVINASANGTTCSE